jgi:receptor expression-enhancing protein 5/6
MSAITAHLDSLRTQIYKTPALKKHAELVEEKTKFPVEYFAVGIIAVLALCVFSGFFAGTITNVVGFLYPVYASIVALETSNKEDDTQWLTYWVVFGFFCIIENFSDYILYWIPFYYAIKVTFLVWCMLPKYQGAKTVYTTLIRPLFQKHENAIDAALNALDSQGAINTAEDATTRVKMAATTTD